MLHLDQIRQQFHDHVELEKRRPTIWQLFLPVYHEDGDMLDVYLEDLPDGRVRVSDGGMSLMRLSYGYNVHTQARERIFHRILAENGVREDGGALYLDVPADDLYPGVMQLVQVQLKVANMELFQREAVRSLFYELLHEFIMDALKAYHPEPDYLPIPGRDELEVDYRLSAGARDIYLFGVRDDSKARVVTISALEFQREHIPHRSVVVHEAFDQLSRKDQARLMSAADKQFPSLEDFERSAVLYLEREAA